jgi:uncharacterized protein YdaU (DUF1376 family)
MPAELTRFDFHVNKFLNSEDVEIMTAEEVGQYILLLCHSFVKGKEASLPDDLAVLSKYARVDKISKIVLKKFPVVDTEWGPRRRNPVMYTEYLSAVKRSLNGRSAVAERWEKESNTPVLRPYNDGNSLVLPNPSHTKPIQSNQPTPTQATNAGNWKMLAIRFREVIGKFISSTKTNKARYSEFCGQYEEDRVLEIFDEWASQNKSWLSEKNDPLFYFWKDLPDLAEASSAQKEFEKKDEVPDIVKIMQADLAERQKTIAEDQEQLRKDREFYEAHKDEI